MTKVIVMLIGGSYIHTHQRTYQDAVDFISKWAQRCRDRVKGKEDACTVENCVFEGHDASGNVVSVAMAEAIIAMYIAEDRPSAQERLVDVLEKQINDGNEWKDQ